ncbi:MAG: hypothetical protein ACPH8B_05380 [Candidatus Puniceispirillum sp.]
MDDDLASMASDLWKKASKDAEVVGEIVLQTVMTATEHISKFMTEKLAVVMDMAAAYLGS